MISRRLYKYVIFTNVLPITQLGFRNGLGTTDKLLLLAWYSLDKLAESRIVPVDFSSAFGLVNHQGSLYKKIKCTGWSVFNISNNF